MSFSFGRLFSGSGPADPSARRTSSTTDGVTDTDSFGTQEALSDHALAALSPVKGQPRSSPPSGRADDAADEGEAELRAKLHEARRQVANLQHLQEETAAKLAAETRAREAEAALERVPSGAVLRAGAWGVPMPQRCIRREGASEAAMDAVRQAVGGGCQSGRGRLLAVTNAVEAGTWRQGDQWLGIGWAPSRGGGGSPPFQMHP